ncbi:hypothetical protein LUX57_40800 [Actinomadura madurae]|nr:histidine kinase dimerization/phospho-acceptor domain-containing protein [Actinomadura madurae]MCP9970730.1 hypothetical protein [Actinomadura madurae]
MADAERLLLARARRRVTAEAAGTIAVLVGAAAWDVRRTAAPGLDAAARRRLLWTFAAAEAGGALAALLIGRATARRALAPAHAALARRERFAAEVTHELRAPLARLHTRAQLAARRLRNGTDVAAEMDRLVADTGRLGEVVDDVLRSTRPGRRPTGPVDLAGLAAELAASERARARERGVAIEVSRKGPAACRPGRGARAAAGAVGPRRQRARPRGAGRPRVGDARRDGGGGRGQRPRRRPGARSGRRRAALRPARRAGPRARPRGGGRARRHPHRGRPGRAPGRCSPSGCPPPRLTSGAARRSGRSRGPSRRA